VRVHLGQRFLRTKFANRGTRRFAPAGSPASGHVENAPKRANVSSASNNLDFGVECVVQHVKLRTSASTACRLAWEDIRKNPELESKRKECTPLFESSGLGHLLHSGRGAGGTNQDGEAEELHVACFMGLVSFLASRVEVLRVAPRHRLDLLDASARATIQSATTTDTPLTDAGLDGTGQVIQVICINFIDAGMG